MQPLEPGQRYVPRIPDETAPPAEPATEFRTPVISEMEPAWVARLEAKLDRIFKVLRPGALP